MTFVRFESTWGSDGLRVLARGQVDHTGCESAMSAQPDQRRENATSKHQAAVARTLESAERAGEIGDYADALQWVQVIEAIGERLPDAFEAKRRLWLDKLAGAHQD